jgi:circadian clock protein KaiC
MTDRISSGAESLDVVLGGGLPRDGITLIVGLPGSGKTILAQQFVFANARPERPALYLSTVSEPLEKILRYGQTLTVFEPAKVGKSVYYEDLGSSVHEGALSGVLDRVRADSFGNAGQRSSSSIASRRCMPMRTTVPTSGGSCTTLRACSAHIR